jgi:hypothetical protein
LICFPVAFFCFEYILEGEPVIDSSDSPAQGDDLTHHPIELTISNRSPSLPSLALQTRQFDMSFDNGIVEAWPEDEYRGNDDLGFDLHDDYDQKPKKNKNNSNSKKTLVEIKHEGYTLEKAQPRVGEKPSWARIGQRPLPFDDKTLVDMVKRHRKRKGTTVDEDFKQLTVNQQGVVQRLLDDRKRKEKTKNAEWILYDVQRFGQWKWRTVDVKQIQVILKRVDKTIPLKNGEYVRNAVKNQYHDFEIIDLAEPTSNNSSKKNKDKKLKKAKSYDDVMFEASDDPLGLSLGLGSNQRDHGRHNSNTHNHFDQQMRDQRPPWDQMPLAPPPMQPPPGAFPQDPNGPGPFGQPPPFPPQQFHQPQPQSARQSQTNIQHPFQPDPNVASMAQFDFPPNINDPILPHPHQNGMDREPAHTQHRERRLSARRQSMSGDPGNIRRLEDKLDSLTIQLGSRKHGGSESSEYGDESVWSYPSDGHSWTPPSSPRSYFSEHRARGSLERRRSSTSRDPRYHPRYRSHRYRDAEIEPAYTYRSDRPYSPEYHRRGSKRPSLIHAATYAADDYPVGSSAQPRALPPAPQPPRQLQRRLTGFEDRDRYENQGYDDRRSDFRDRHDSRDVPDSRRFDDRYDSRRRDSVYEGGRRRSSQQYW